MPATSKRKRRTVMRTAHRWLGLTLGLLFCLLGLTGSLLVFYPELDRILHPQLTAGRAVGELQPDRIVEALQRAEPTRSGSWRIELPRADDAPISARYYKPVETQGRHFAPLILTLDPGSLSPTSRRFWGSELFTWVYDLHYSLLLGKEGKTLLGLATLPMLFLLLSGVYLWWPDLCNLKGALTMKSGASWKRRVYDLHVKPGIYAALLFVTLTLTGLLLAVPEWLTPLIDTVSPRSAYYQAESGFNSTQPGIAASEAVRIARERFPDAEVRWIHTPDPDRGVWRIQLRQAGEPNRRFPRTNVWIDAGSGTVLAVRDPRQNSAGDTLMDWLHPLHNGEAFGTTGRIVVFLCGLLPLLALVTGFIRWRHKAAARAACVKPFRH